MGAADLDYRTRTFTGLYSAGPGLAACRLGHAEEVALQAGRGEWFARAWARLPAGQDRQALALEVLAPYVTTGWWTAAETTAELLEGWGRIEEAISLARPYTRALRGSPLAPPFDPTQGAGSSPRLHAACTA